jgi:very-short-patch-repair endonuclease
LDNGYSRPTRRSRELRAGATEAERKLWHHLKARKLMGTRFNRQFPVGQYIGDFVSRSRRLIIEIDGGHHGRAEERIHDERRTAFLRAQGYQVIRFWNSEVLDNVEGVLRRIEQALEDMPSPGPSRRREGSLWSHGQRRRDGLC